MCSATRAAGGKTYPLCSHNPRGNSNAALNYSFTDLNPAKGLSQYRILQVDLDGSGHYSEIRSVPGNGVSGSLIMFPNPSSTGAVTLLFDSEDSKDLTVSDVAGCVVQQVKDVTESSYDFKNLSSGFYTVQVRDAATGTTTIKKFLVNKQ